jgi:probable F420-dependent oxidoreductase
MRLSLELPVAFPESIAQCAAAIERAGFDACFVTDHPYPPRDWLTHGGHLTLDPFVALATAAAATTTLRVHTHCLIPAYRNPYLSAKAIASLDAISRGRVILGVAAGYLEGEFEGLSVPFAQRGQLLDEALRAMQEAWAEQSPNSVLPAPVQQPRPPIWVGGNTSVAMQRAATYDGWAPFPASPSVARRVRTADLADHAAVASAVARFHELAGPDADVCFTPFSHPAYKDVVDPDAFVDEARELQRAGVTWLTFHLPAPSPAAFCDVVASFGAAVASKVRS